MPAKRNSIALHPQFIEMEGKPVYAVLPIGEYNALVDAVETGVLTEIMEDALRKEKDAATVSLAEVKAMLAR